MVRLKSEVTTTKSSDADEILLTFTKLQGLGNDFVVLSLQDFKLWSQANFGDENAPALSELARKLCNRKYGIGADGLILVDLEPPTCDVGWTYLNSDGSSSLMCGNGLRCLAHWCITNGVINKDEFTVQTGKGPVVINYQDSKTITTDLGSPLLASDQIPVDTRVVPEDSRVVSYELELASRKISLTCVSMGNPHCVLFDAGLAAKDFEPVATEIQNHPFFPESVNVSFVTAYDEKNALVTVWERGCGLTLACASGAAAVLVAGVLEGKLKRRSTITLPGGALIVEWRESDDRVLITGPAHTSFTGGITKQALQAVPS